MEPGWANLFCHYYRTGDITEEAWEDFVEAGGPNSISCHWNPSQHLGPPSTREAFVEIYLCHYYSPARDGALEELEKEQPYSFQQRLELSLAALACAGELTQAAAILNSGLLPNKYVCSALWLTVRYGSAAAMELLLHPNINQRSLWQLLGLSVGLGRWRIFRLLLSKISFSHHDVFQPATELVVSLIRAARLKKLNFYLHTLVELAPRLLPFVLERVLTNKHFPSEWYLPLMHEWTSPRGLAEVVFLRFTPSPEQLQQLLDSLEARLGAAALDAVIEAALVNDNFHLGRLGKAQMELLWARVQDSLGPRLKSSFVKRVVYGNAYPVVKYILESYPLLSLEELAMQAFYAGGISDSVVALCRAGLALRQQQEPFLRWVVNILRSNRHLTLQEITLIECQSVEVLINVQQWLSALGLGWETFPAQQTWSMLRHPDIVRSEFIDNVRKLLPRPHQQQQEWWAAEVGLGWKVVGWPNPNRSMLWRCYLQRALYYPLETFTEGLAIETDQLFGPHPIGVLSQLLIYGRLEIVQFALNSLSSTQRQGLQANLAGVATFLGCEDALQV